MAPQDVVAAITTPNASDAQIAVDLLRQNGIATRSFSSIDELGNSVDESVGCLVLLEEALLVENIPVLSATLASQPAWSDLPLVIVASDVAAFDSVATLAFPNSGNVTLLERPLSGHTFVSAVRVALRAAVRQREVAELIAERERAVKLRDEFLAMLAHELRNPLAPMRNALYLLRMAKPDDPLIAKSTEVLERQIHHVVRMVDDLLDVARLERRKVTLQKERVDLNSVVASAVEACLPAAQQKGLRVMMHFAVDAVTVEADPVRIEQIVTNLVNNAAKFSSGPGQIQVETCSDGQYATIAVQDQGVGFEPTNASTLFDPFIQATNTLERSAGGLGLGLTIVKRLAELHGGSVSATSEGAGKGSSFVVRLPLASATLTSAPTSQDVPAAARRLRIVIIEDNADIRETLHLLLTLWGHDVTMAADGMAGVTRVLEDRPDLALIDVGLPVMNGYDVARAIRKSVPAGTLRLIAVTGYGQPSDKELALEAGFDAHVLKPVAPEVLQKLLVSG